MITLEKMKAKPVMEIKAMIYDLSRQIGQLNETIRVLEQIVIEKEQPANEEKDNNKK